MTSSALTTPVAVIGMACRLPGADNLDEFWELVVAGRKAFGPAPADRFDRELYFDPRKGVLGKSYTELGGVVSYGPIDRRLCPIPEDAIGRYDIAHLTLCEVAAAACRHAGMDPRAIPHRNTGVYVGHARASGLGGDLAYAAHVAEAAEYLHEVPGFDRLPEGLRKEIVCDVVDHVRAECPHMTADGPFLAANLAAGLISKFFGLDGPAMVFNAACASSLHALVQAVRALQLGDIDMALVGGASYFHSDTLVLFSQAYSVSNRGSFPFSDEADGLVVAEGYVMLVLKTLDRALADRNRILAVIPSVSIATDGRGKSLWAPRKEGQVEAMRRAYDDRVRLDRVQYIEAHATSTALGDATELSALQEVFSGRLPPGVKIPIGSVKANVGHTLEAAGATSMAKVILALEHRVIPPGIDDRRLNTQVDWDRLPVFVPRRAMEWPAPADGHPRRAGVNAFGIGGMNVHVVVDEYLPGKSASWYRPAGVPRSPAAVLSPADRAIAIVGMGSIFPGARTLEAFWDLLVSGRDARVEAPRDRWNPAVYCRPFAADPWTVPTTLGGFVTDFQYDWRKHKIPPKQIQQASPLQFMILDAVDQALERAGYHARPFDRRRTGVVVGTIFGGDFSGQLAVALQLPAFRRTLAQVMRRHGVPESTIDQTQAAFQEVLLKHMPALLDETGSFTANVLASRITKSFDLMGGGVAVDAGTASSMAALACSIDLLLARHCDLMICVGAQQSMSPATYAVWKQLGALAPGRSPAPFDARAQGAVPGEGCGVLVLKRLEDARRDGDQVMATLRGIGAGFGPSRAQAIQTAISRAMRAAGLRGSDVAVLETLGTGNAQLDAEEIQAIAQAYKTGRRREPVRLGTVVGQIGNTGGASGMASLVKAALELDRRQAPAVSQLHTPAPFVVQQRPVLELPQEPAPIGPAETSRGEIAAVQSCGGDEVVYHVLMERGAPVISSMVDASISSVQEAPIAAAGGRARSRILYFDATARRREAMRRKAADTPAARAVPASPSRNGSAARSVPESTRRPEETARVATPAAPAAMPSPTPSQGSRPGAGSAPSSAGDLRAMAPPRDAKPVAGKPLAEPPAEPFKPERDPKELESFLVNFVVEQTGYPPEIVELDADLEADLGIDSIKKAQLFGELGEYFDIRPDSNLTLDDFPTLRHVLDYLVKNLGASAAPAPATAALSAAPAQAPAPSTPA
ncbi:MAG: phosphopantetheine-binding protein, partial [Thermoguttaceae bacterium]|nr:phosphopantetheine-binding protein [Thermoguttaceae bacterium]